MAGIIIGIANHTGRKTGEKSTYGYERFLVKDDSGNNVQLLTSDREVFKTKYKIKTK